MSYSVLAVTAVVAVLVVDLAVYRTRMVTRKVFWTAYAIIVFFQLLMNGVLTGLDVVVYDERTIWGPRIAYAPVEDLLFGFAMVTLTLASWAAVNRRANTARRRGLDTDTRPSSTRCASSTPERIRRWSGASSRVTSIVYAALWPARDTRLCSPRSGWTSRGATAL